MHRLIAPMLVVMALAGPAAADVRALQDFTSVQSSGKIRVEVTQGAAYAVRVDGSDAERVVTTVSRGTLRISTRGTSWFGNNRRLDAHVRISAPRIDALSAARGTEMNVDGDLRSNDMSLTAVQGGSLTIPVLYADDLSINASQGGAVDVSGECGTVHASASMGGALDADGVNCARAYVSASMGGGVSVHAREMLEANASMGGAIDVSGNPPQNDTSSMMGGAISIN